MRILTNICSDDLQKGKEFYVELLDFKVKYESDWYGQRRFLTQDPSAYLIDICSPWESQ